MSSAAWLAALLTCLFFAALAPREMYTLSLHDALPIYMIFGTFENPEYFDTEAGFYPGASKRVLEMLVGIDVAASARRPTDRSEEHTSELQSRRDLVCRLLLEKKK